MADFEKPNSIFTDANTLAGTGFCGDINYVPKLNGQPIPLETFPNIPKWASAICVAVLVACSPVRSNTQVAQPNYPTLPVGKSPTADPIQAQIDDANVRATETMQAIVTNKNAEPSATPTATLTGPQENATTLAIHHPGYGQTPTAEVPIDLLKPIRSGDTVTLTDLGDLGTIDIEVPNVQPDKEVVDVDSAQGNVLILNSSVRKLGWNYAGPNEQLLGGLFQAKEYVDNEGNPLYVLYITVESTPTEVTSQMIFGYAAPGDWLLNAQTKRGDSSQPFGKKTETVALAAGTRENLEKFLKYYLENPEGFADIHKTIKDMVTLK